LTAVGHEISGQTAQQVKHSNRTGGHLAQHDVVALPKDLDAVLLKPKLFGQTHGLAVARLENTGIGHSGSWILYQQKVYTLQTLKSMMALQQATEKP
jgi:hypothetical protein